MGCLHSSHLITVTKNSRPCYFLIPSYVPATPGVLTLFISITLLYSAAILSGCSGVTSAKSDSATSTATIVPSGALTLSTTRLNFNNVNVGSKSALSVSLTSSGTFNITVSSVTISGAGFASSGVSSGQIITPGELVTLNVTFAPAAIGSVTGSITVASNALNSPAAISLSGTGIQVIFHSATLNWTASTSTVI